MEIVNRRGLHARASAALARTAQALPSRIELARDGQRVTATSIMGLMLLGAARGDRVEIIVTAEAEETAAQDLASIADLIASRFGEAD